MSTGQSSSENETGQYAVPEPESIEETGLAPTTLEHLILKILYFRGDVYGQDLSSAIGLKFSVIQDLVESLKLKHVIQVKRSLGMGSVGAVFALTEVGRELGRQCLEANHYAGPAPVPLEQYVEVVRRQRCRDGWLTKEMLADAFRGMVITERLLAQIGPAVSSGSSLLLYGKPGDGKSYLIESLNNLEATAVFIPYALECQGNVVQVFDPIYHERIEEEKPSVLTIAVERSYDRRWVRCRRPFIVTGGELSMDMLDLRYNPTSKIYEAPYQLKANNGVYLIDDFGRQRAAPAEVLNRWIVPMERRVDYLSFLSGGKMTVPFETFLVFSTNLNPTSLGDEAFLRRIQYKLLLRGPAENEFVRIFERFCGSRGIACSREMIVGFIDRHYRRTNRPFRRCHPRDVLTHALNLMHFEKLPVQLSDEILDRAFDSCFVEEQDDERVADSPVVPVMTASCSDFWSERVVQIPTVFGTLAFVASFRDPQGGTYYEQESVRRFGEAETARVLVRLHQRAYVDWSTLSREEQRRDLKRHLGSEGTSAARAEFEKQAWIERLAPPQTRPEQISVLAHDLRVALAALTPEETRDVVPGLPLRDAIARTA